VTLYRYDTSTPVPTNDKTNISNYQYLTGDRDTSMFGSAGNTIMFQVKRVLRPSNYDGFCLGIRDTGTCGTPLIRMIVYYKICPARISGLVNFAEHSVPPINAPNSSYSGSCAPNSHNMTSLVVDIHSPTSECTERAVGGARCKCNGGYYQFNETFCEGKSTQ